MEETSFLFLELNKDKKIGHAYPCRMKEALENVKTLKRKVKDEILFDWFEDIRNTNDTFDVKLFLEIKDI